MKKIKAGEYADKQCDQCERAAQWRATRLPLLLAKMYCCDEHKQSIIAAETKAPARTDHFSEADSKTWMQL